MAARQGDDLQAHRVLLEVRALRAEVAGLRQLLLERWEGDDDLAERRQRLAGEALARFDRERGQQPDNRVRFRR